MNIARKLWQWTLLSLSLNAAASAQSVLTDDSFISSATTKVNYGSSIALVVTSGSNSYLKFSLANLPPGTAGSNIAGASAVLFVDAVLKSGTMDVYALNSPWSENSLTYNTAPNADGSRAHRHVEYVYRRSDRQRQADRVRRCAIC